VATLPTWQELYDAARTEVQARNAELTDWTEGSVLDALTGGGAVLADEVIRVLVALFAAQFVDTASGSDLDALAADRFGLSRNAASSAVGTITWTRDAAGAYAIPAGTRVRATVNGQSVTFTTDSDASLGASDSSVDIDVTCSTTGPTGNVAAGTLTTVVDTVVADPSATITNAERATGGAVEETDAAFRDRIRRYFTSLRKGTVEALKAGALSVAGVSYATVNESYIDPDDGGYVAVYVGDPDGRGNTALAALVETELEDWRAAGVYVQVLAAAREEVSLALTLRVTRGADTATLAASVRAAVLAYTDQLDPNETLYLSQVEHAALGVSEDVLDAEVTSPTSNETPSSPQNALRVAAGDLSLTWVEV